MKILKKKLQSQIVEIIENAGWDKYQDIHITDIFEVLNKKDWGNACLFLVDILDTYIDKSNYRWVISCSLEEGGNNDLMKINQNEFIANFDSSPPSLYIFPIESEIIDKSIYGSVKIFYNSDRNIVFHLNNDKGVIFLIHSSEG